MSETRLHENDPLKNIEIDGYEFCHTPTATQCGCVEMYVKINYRYIRIPIYWTKKRKPYISYIIGYIYRHYMPITTFLGQFFQEALNTVCKQSIKICAIMGDFNIDLIKYATKTHTRGIFAFCSLGLHHKLGYLSATFSWHVTQLVEM